MQNYSLLQQYLHDLVFKNKFINKSLFEIEKLLFLEKMDIKNKIHVFITGLPRSGTTSILNFIYSSGEFASLKFSNMPFILSPNISKFLYKKDIEKKERVHSDGIKYSLESPEAFDEIFLKSNDIFVKEELQNYLSLILKSERKARYLSKNNLNYRRIDFLVSLFPYSIFLIPVREPLQHSYSLLKQHEHFIKLQQDNNFVTRYMNYLNHNEFGLNHIPWNKPEKYYDSGDINYWLEQWLIFYENIFAKFNSHSNCVFLGYEKLSDVDYLKKIIEKINIISLKKINLNYFKISRKEIKLTIDENIYAKAIKIYNKLTSLFLDKTK